MGEIEVKQCTKYKIPNAKQKMQNTKYNCIYIQWEIEVTPKLGLNSRDSFNSGNENIPPSI